MIKWAHRRKSLLSLQLYKVRVHESCQGAWQHLERLSVGTWIQEQVREVESQNLETGLWRPASRCRSTVFHGNKHLYTDFLTFSSQGSTCLYSPNTGCTLLWPVLLMVTVNSYFIRILQFQYSCCFYQPKILCRELLFIN